MPRSGRYDAEVTEPQRPPSPGERRLERPPSDRYLDTTTAATPTTPAGSAGRALAAGFLAGLVGIAATIVLGGVLGVTTGLLVVAGATGWGVALATVAGGGRALRPGVRRWLAVALAIDAVVLGQLGLWLYARAEGGVLPPLDYLAQTFGLLVPLQAVVAVGIAWWAAR